MKATAESDKVRDEIEQETRFAVVLYGGVSLAVYISGVCRELLGMVRATALPKPAVGTTNGGQPALRQPHGSEVAYRLASCLVGRRDSTGALTQCEQKAQETVQGILDGYKAETGTDDDRKKWIEEHVEAIVPRRRFVVDVLTGTSAGGLNAVFLGKALAHDLEIEHLRELWVNQGGFDNILNDDSAAGVHDKIVSRHGKIKTDPTKSLLSGDLMYLKLLNALDLMHAGGAPSAPLVDALDLYLTTTDLRGLSLPVDLGDHRFIQENRHRSVFHLAFGTSRNSGSELNHLDAKHNPGLAFIARATSAHPAAFEAVQAKAVSEGLEQWIAGTGPKPPVGASFLASRLSPKLRYGPNWDERMAKRWYSDGGDMDNKPFTYVLDPIRKRRAEVPVDRQLVYVEPDPKIKGVARSVDHVAPSFVETTFGAFNLGRSENIREDIERVLDRNTTLRRMKRGFDDQVAVLAQTLPGPGEPSAPRPYPTTADWVEATYAKILATEGDSELAYEMHKLSWVGAELGELMADIANLAADTAQRRWIVEMAQEYARKRYVPANLETTLDQPNLHRPVLLGIDLGYRLRRLRFVDQVLRRLQEAEHDGTIGDLCLKWRLDQDEITFIKLRQMRRALNETDVDLRTVGRALHADRAEEAFGDRRPRWDEQDQDWRKNWADNSQTESDESFELDKRPTLLSKWQVSLPAWTERIERMAFQLPLNEDHKLSDAECDTLDDIVADLTHQLGPWLMAASAKTSGAIDAVLAGTPRLHKLIKAVYDEYAGFDHFVLPGWGEVQGELAEAGITRISPHDACRLMHVSTVPGHEVHKLAGNSLGHFGGFLDADWRSNDIMWGRLDAAEVIINRVLNDDNSTEQIRDGLVDLAHDRILSEEWSTVSLLSDLSEHDLDPDAHGSLVDQKRRVTSELPEDPHPEAARSYIQNYFSASLDPAGRIKRDLVGRALDALGGMTAHHAILEPKDRGEKVRLGQILALVLRAIRLGFPEGTDKVSKWYLHMQRVVYAAAVILPIFGVIWAFVHDWRSAALTLGAVALSAASGVLTFDAAGTGRSSLMASVIKLGGLIVPFAAVGAALTINLTAAAACLAATLVTAIALTFALPAIVANRALSRVLQPGRPTAIYRAGRARLPSFAGTKTRMEVPTSDTRRKPADSTHRYERTIRGTRQQVYDALIEPARLFGGVAAISGGPEGPAVTPDDRPASFWAAVTTADPDTATNRVRDYKVLFEDLVENRRVSWRWGIDTSDEVDDHEGIVSVQLRDVLGNDGHDLTSVLFRSTFLAPENRKITESVAATWRVRVEEILDEIDDPGSAANAPSTSAFGQLV